MILDKINESGIKHRTFNVDNLRTTDDILQVLDIIHREVVDGMVNITIVCHLDCIERILKQVINYLVSKNRGLSVYIAHYWYIDSVYIPVYGARRDYKNLTTQLDMKN